ncbi:MAG: alpha/beta fold hydrolase [Thermoplasmataceae archaeon]
MSNFVMVHGAWLGSWVWKKILPELRGQGHEVYPITLTGMGDRVHLAREEYGIETAIQDVINLIEYEDLDNVTLIGHSFAGKVISAVYDKIPERIRLLLFLDASIPKKIRTPQGGIANWSPDEVKKMKEESMKNGDGWKYSLSESALEEFGFDLKGKDKEWFMSKVTPWPLNLAWNSITLSEKVDEAKKAYVICTKYGEELDENDKKYLSQLDGEYRLIESGHYPMITKPDELIKAILALNMKK